MKLKNLLEKEFRTKIITIVTMIYNFVWSIAKIVFGAILKSYSFCISGIYILLTAFIKKTFISNRGKSENLKVESKSFLMGMLITISGFAFAVYMGLLIVFPKDYQYNIIISIFIATCSFFEIGIAIYNFLKAKKQNDILFFSLKASNLASGAFAICITQIALLSATGTTNVEYYNAISGIVAGIIAIVLGTIVMLKATKLKNNKKINIS